MKYEINVSRNGSHYFATHDRSVQSTKTVRALVLDFEKRFPKSEGFRVTFSMSPEGGVQFDAAELGELTDEELYTRADRKGQK